MTDTNSVINWDEDENSEEFNEDSSVESAGAFSSGEMVVADDAPTFAGDSEHITIVQIDPNTGDEVRETIDLALPPLTVGEAQDITERIKTTTNVLYLLIKRAHAGKAYTALGYSTFEEYVRAEFSYSRSYAYKLLNQANVIAAIEEKAPEGTTIYIGDATARGLKKVLPQVVAEVESKTAGLPANEAGAVIEEIIREHREKERERMADLDDESDDDGEGGGDRKFDGPYTGDYDGGGFDDDDDSDDEEVTGFLNEDPAAQRRKFDKLYNLYSGLKSIDSVGDGEELPNFVPEERKIEFDNLIETVTPWLIEFRELWRAQKVTAEAEENSEDDDPETGLDFEE